MKRLKISSIDPQDYYDPSMLLRSPPPSIGLDGEPETIKEFAAKQH